MSKELSINRISNRSTGFVKDARSRDSKDVNNVYDFEIEAMKRKRDEAIKQIVKDSKSLKW